MGVCVCVCVCVRACVVHNCKHGRIQRCELDWDRGKLDWGQQEGVAGLDGGGWVRRGGGGGGWLG